MPISLYYQELREQIGDRLIFCPSVVGIVRNNHGEVLFMQGADSKLWSPPAGAIEPGETTAQAVVREVWEETGLHVSPKHLLGAFGGHDFRHTYPNGHQVEYVIFVFECEVESGTLQAVDGEAVDLKYFAPSAMPPLQFPYPRDMFYPSDDPKVIFQTEKPCFR